MNCQNAIRLTTNPARFAGFAAHQSTAGRGFFRRLKRTNRARGWVRLLCSLGIVSFVLWSNLVMIGIIAALAGLICGICARGSARAIVGIILSSINLAFVILALIISFIQIAVK